jgi:hypothetical protein
MNLTQQEFAVRWADGPGRYFASQRDRSRLSRRRFIAATAGVAGLATSRLWRLLCLVKPLRLGSKWWKPPAGQFDRGA